MSSCCHCTLWPLVIAVHRCPCLLADCCYDEGVRGEKPLSWRWRRDTARLLVWAAGVDDDHWGDWQPQWSAVGLRSTSDRQDTSRAPVTSHAVGAYKTRPRLTKFCCTVTFDFIRSPQCKVCAFLGIWSLYYRRNPMMWLLSKCCYCCEGTTKLMSIALC